MQTWRLKLGSVSTQKLVIETRMQNTEMTANTRAALELVGSSHNSHKARCHDAQGTVCSCSVYTQPFAALWLDIINYTINIVVKNWHKKLQFFDRQLHISDREHVAVTNFNFASKFS